jgi:hypothetical protein
MHGEYIVNDAVVYVAKPSDRMHAPGIEHAGDDDTIVDVDVGRGTTSDVTGSCARLCGSVRGS